VKVRGTASAQPFSTGSRGAHADSSARERRVHGVFTGEEHADGMSFAHPLARIVVAYDASPSADAALAREGWQLARLAHRALVPERERPLEAIPAIQPR
jgi:hypothetical protein